MNSRRGRASRRPVDHRVTSPGRRATPARAPRPAVARLRPIRSRSQPGRSPLTSD